MCSVTAVLFTYNQERYVRYAFEDLINQDIDMMTIIISDDCSTDSTYSIIKYLTKTTKSRFDISVDQNRVRLGFNEHINRIITKSSTEIIIPFAGDDRFYPSRARILRDNMRKSSALLAHSDCSFITATGQQHSPINQNATFYHTTDPFTAVRSQALFIGATAAWSRKLFERYGQLPKSPYEDLVLGFRASLEQKIQYIPQKLMSYRVGVGRSTPKISNREECLRKRSYLLHAHRHACHKHADTLTKLIELIDQKLFELRIRRLSFTSMKRLCLIGKKKPFLSLLFLVDEFIKKMKCNTQHQRAANN